jgi:hypothetical protein
LPIVFQAADSTARSFSVFKISHKRTSPRCVIDVISAIVVDRSSWFCHGITQSYFCVVGKFIFGEVQKLSFMRAAGSEAAPQKLKRDLHPSKKNSNLRLLTQRQIVNIDHLDRTGLE